MLFIRVWDRTLFGGKDMREEVLRIGLHPESWYKGKLEGETFPISQLQREVLEDPVIFCVEERVISTDWRRERAELKEHRCHILLNDYERAGTGGSKEYFVGKKLVEIVGNGKIIYIGGRTFQASHDNTRKKRVPIQDVIRGTKILVEYFKQKEFEAWRERMCMTQS